MTVSYSAIADRAVAIIGSADPTQYLSAFSTMANETVTTERSSLTSSEVLGVILLNRSEWTSLTDAQRQVVRDILTVYEEIPVQAGESARDTLVAILGANSRADLVALLPSNEPVWPGLAPGHVQNALEMRQRGEI